MVSHFLRFSTFACALLWRDFGVISSVWQITGKLPMPVEPQRQKGIRQRVRLLSPSYQVVLQQF